MHARMMLPVLMLAAAAGLGSTSGVRAQASSFLNVAGYGVLGGAVGATLTSGATCSGFVCIPEETLIATVGGLILGVFVGGAISSTANQTVADGRPIGSAHLFGVSVGTVLGGATLGALSSALLINGEGSGTPLGSDEQTFTLLTLAGAAFGVWHLRRNWDALTGGRVEVQPAILPDGRAALSGRVRL